MLADRSPPTLRPQRAPNPSLADFIEIMAELIARRVLADYRENLKCSASFHSQPESNR